MQIVQFFSSLTTFWCGEGGKERGTEGSDSRGLCESSQPKRSERSCSQSVSIAAIPNKSNYAICRAHESFLSLALLRRRPLVLGDGGGDGGGEGEQERDVTRERAREKRTVTFIIVFTRPVADRECLRFLPFHPIREEEAVGVTQW